MKKLLFTLVTLCVSSLTMAQTPTENYVKTTSYQVKTPTGTVPNADKIESITYVDGLGRPKQNVAVRAGGQSQDIITYIGYDDYGRQDKDYLPYATSSTGNGAYKSDAENEVITFYGTTKYENTANPYSQKTLENSPLSRVLSQAAPGYDWRKGGGHEIEFDYLTNTGSEVRHYTVGTTATVINNVTTYVPTLSMDTSAGNNNGYYRVNELYKTVTKDENHDGTSSKAHTTEEFKDKQGRVVLKRTYGTSTVNGTPQTNVAHDTYYVYDDYGNLTYVLPPKAEPNTALPSAPTLLELCYQYRYDDRNRLVEKRIPGKDREYIVYNKLDQPILTQDSKQKTKGEWLFTKYDAFGRVTYTGKATSNTATTREAIQGEINNFTGNLWVTQGGSATNFGGVNIFYNNGAYPNNGTPAPLVALSEILTVNYYDTYVDRPTGVPTSITLVESPTNETNMTNVKGLATVSKVKVLDVSGTNAWINTLTYYDTKSRPVYVYTENTYLGTVDIVESKLDFVGNPIKTKTSHTKNGVTITTLENFTYDHAGRLKTQTQCIGDETMGYTCPGSNASVDHLSLTGTINTNQVASNSITVNNGTILSNTRLWIDPEPQEMIASYTYDELGQLGSKGVGGEIIQSRLQTIDYAYNVRGWLKQINQDSNNDNDLFNFSIKYNDITDVNKKLYNGNISQTSWNTLNEDSSTKTYSYSYDALNRITSGVDNTDRYNLTSVTYDKNGNITSLARQGHVVENPVATNSSHFGAMDNLVYTYNSGNKLLKIKDHAHAEYGFKESEFDDQDYWHDINGNMIEDHNKGIAAIDYNHLNLPTLIEMEGTVNEGNIAYIYDALGTKLKKVTEHSLNATLKTVEYAGNYVYEDGSLKFFNHPEGYVDAENGYAYVYQYKDHLGNVRLSYKDNNGALEILEENNYYPFGLKHKGYNNVINGTDHPYGYNGMEENDELGLNTLDFGARNYDAALGRWMNIDPLAENSRRWTPYNFAYNNPIYFVDPDGMQATDWFRNSEGAVVFDENINSQQDLDDAGIDGEYIAESFTAKDQNNDVFVFNEDGTVTDSDATTPMMEAAGIDTSSMVEVTSTLVDDGESDVAKASIGVGAFLLADDATVIGAVDDVLLPVVAVVAAVATMAAGERIYSFAKDSSKNERHGDSGALGKAGQQIAELEAQLANATGKAAKKIKQKIQNVKRNAAKNKKGETHSRNAKGN